MNINTLIEKLEPKYNCFVSLWEKHGKELSLSLILVLFSLFVLYKSTPTFVSHVFQLTISQNKGPITSLDTERDISQVKKVWVDHLNLKDGYHLRHPKLGQFGFAGNFFIDLEAEFEVKVPGLYYLIPGSDDGFTLAVNGETLCEYKGSRPYRTHSCRVELEEGTNNFKLSYYQGAGHSGLTLAYRHQDMKKQRWFGEDSKYLSF